MGRAERTVITGPTRTPAVAPLTVPELELGLRMLGRTTIDQDVFWDIHIARFRHTVLLAIRETSDALLSPYISAYLRLELQSQLEALVGYIEVADRHNAERIRRFSAPIS